MRPKTALNLLVLKNTVEVQAKSKFVDDKVVRLKRGVETKESSCC